MRTERGEIIYIVKMLLVFEIMDDDVSIMHKVGKKVWENDNDDKES